MHVRISAIGLLAAALALALAGGCSQSSSPKTVTGVTLSTRSADVEVCHTVSLTANVHGGESKAVDWFVNGVYGGEATTGTINQTNPAVFTAPGELPGNATVVVKAVSQEEPSIYDSCLVTIEFTVIHVDAGAGNDETGTGCQSRPFKTITRGIAAASPGMTVEVADGLYDGTNGETFPLVLNGAITLLGESPGGTIIRENTDAHYGLYMTGENPRIRRFTIDSGGAPIEDLTAAIVVDQTAIGAVVDSLTFPDRAYYSVIRIASAHNTTVRNCRLVAETQPVEGRGFEIVFNDSGTVVSNCVISGFIEGLFFNYSSDALIEHCTIENNTYGVGTCCNDSEPPSNPRPDFGGGARNSPGGNIIRNNATIGLSNEGASTIYAKHNTWGHNPPTVGCTAGSDICNSGAGSVIWE